MHLDLLAAQYVRAGETPSRGAPAGPREVRRGRAGPGVAQGSGGLSDARVDGPRRAVRGAGPAEEPGLQPRRRPHARGRRRRERGRLQLRRRGAAAAAALSRGRPAGGRAGDQPAGALPRHAGRLCRLEGAQRHLRDAVRVHVQRVRTDRAVRRRRAAVHRRGVVRLLSDASRATPPGPDLSPGRGPAGPRRGRGARSRPLDAPVRGRAGRRRTRDRAGRAHPHRDRGDAARVRVPARRPRRVCPAGAHRAGSERPAQPQRGDGGPAPARGDPGAGARPHGGPRRPARGGPSPHQHRPRRRGRRASAPAARGDRSVPRPRPARGGARPAHRVRQRVEPATGPDDLPGPGDDGSRRPGRRTVAHRARLVAIESLLLALVGGGVGIGVATWGVGVLRDSISPEMSRWIQGFRDIGVDWPVLAFSLAALRSRPASCPVSPRRPGRGGPR